MLQNTLQKTLGLRIISLFLFCRYIQQIEFHPLLLFSSPSLLLLCSSYSLNKLNSIYNCYSLNLPFCYCVLYIQQIEFQLVFVILFTYPSVIAFFIFNKSDSIQAVHYIVLRHPLVSVLPSLGRQPDDFRRSSKV